MTSDHRLLDDALALHEAGALAEADAIYRRLIAENPGDAEALHLSGLVAQARGDEATALALIGAAIVADPVNPLFFSNRATILLAKGDLAGAGEDCRAGLRLNPGDALCWHKFGTILAAQARLDQAIDVFTHALSLKPDHLPSLGARGQALQRSGRFDEAEACYRHYLGNDPAQPDILANLGTLYQSQGRLDEATVCYRASLAAKAENPVALHNLATALKKQNQLAEAVAIYRQALSFASDSAETLTGLGSALQAQGKLDEATHLYHRALDLDPLLPEALNNLMFALCAHPDTTSADLHDITRARVQPLLDSHLEPVFANPPDPQRRIRIGYVSPDFRHHPVGYFLAGVLPCHDPEAIEIHCYSTSRIVDDTTRRLQAATPHWHSVADLPAEDLAAKIRADGIDLLIDLSGHMANHRLSVFARRAAPVQASWLGYFSTTGIPRMDHIIADACVIPPGEERFYTESVARLPGCYLCFDGSALDLPVSPLPADVRGTVTFGCLNRRDKLNPPLIRVWAEILTQTPGSRLLLKTSSFSDPETHAAMISAFDAQGISPDRLLIEGHSDRRTHLGAYHHIDIALDSFPYGGATTTAETLWMGVPIITLEGTTFVGRVGASMLRRIGHPDWIAATPQDYIAKAVSLAQDLPRLGTLRARLRARTEATLCDGRQFTADLEALFRKLWQDWCAIS